MPTGAQTAVTSAESFNTLNLSGTVGLSMTGSGSLALLGRGLLGNTSGSIGGGVLTGSANGELIVITPANLTIGSVIADNGGATALTKAGAATLILTGSNTYTGCTTVSSGTLQILTQGALPCGGLDVAAGGTLILGPDSTLQSLAAEESLDISSLGDGSTSGSDPAISSSSAFNAPTVSRAASRPVLNPVPEPGTLLLLLAAGGGSLLWHIRASGSRSPNANDWIRK